MGFDPSRLEGRILINLDSEEEDTLYIGCAGGVNTEGILPVQWEASPRDWKAYTLSITGLTGGHSGGDIHKNLGNALLMGAALITELRLLGARLAGFSGGGKHNAIPRECFAELLVAPGQTAEAEKLMAAGAAGFIAEWSDIEPGLKIEFTPAESVPQEVLTADSFQKAGDLLFSMPHGVIGMSRKIENLVETSTNMAQADLNGERLHILTSQRSSSNFLRDNAGAKVLACIRAAGGEAWHNRLYPGWNPNPSSPLLGIAKKAFRSVMNHDPHIKAIHAGLECGVIGAKIPGIDMISFGPDLEMVHTPQERMRISSVEKIWNLLLEVLVNLK
jgi:dipeptidase D